jgi:hypothetical protein
MPACSIDLALLTAPQSAVESSTAGSPWPAIDLEISWKRRDETRRKSLHRGPRKHAKKTHDYAIREAR